MESRQTHYLKVAGSSPAAATKNNRLKRLDMTAKIKCYRPSSSVTPKDGPLRLPTVSEVKELENCAYDFAKGKWTRFAHRFQIPRHIWVSAECEFIGGAERANGKDTLPLRLVSDKPFKGSIRIGSLYWQNASQQTVCDMEEAASYDSKFGDEKRRFLEVVSMTIARSCGLNY